MAPSWGSCSVMLAPFSDQVGLGTVFESTYLRKSGCSRNITFSHGFGPKRTPRWGRPRLKIAPRRVQERLGSLFFRLEFSLRFLIGLGSALVPFWAPKWSPWGEGKLGVPPPWAIQDGLGIVLVRLFFRLTVWDQVWCPLGCLLGSCWGALGVIFGHLESSWARFWALRMAF